MHPSLYQSLIHWKDHFEIQKNVSDSNQLFGLSVRQCRPVCDQLTDYWDSQTGPHLAGLDQWQSPINDVTLLHRPILVDIQRHSQCGATPRSSFQRDVTAKPRLPPMVCLDDVTSAVSRDRASVSFQVKWNSSVISLLQYSKIFMPPDFADDQKTSLDVCCSPRRRRPRKN